ncbi:DUF3050 domain-containing protein [Flavobacterium difficile]|uniref:DUF3050 domain-containing protein n=1 Tax=Flavobacterium difficile TaxID=2709659 RepID=A0ABX0IA98_9FLAO|nr:DUF3050 domain-containing protein [Flavobacterium difficile]NHM02356.1 DUF3050 domain-containing protein [Flavobacterium difficile]
MNTQEVKKSIEHHKQELLNHSLYKNVTSVEELHTFLEYHVFAVWDFMSLLKGLQIHLTSVSIPWKPIGNPEIRYLINEIVVAEETDISFDGKRQSHFEMYIDAMQECGASTDHIFEFLANVEKTKNIFVSIKASKLPEEVKAFLTYTFTIVEEGEPHKIASAFTFGREDLIPNMFTEILRNFQVNFPDVNLSKLIYYFERHIELDADEHGPMAMKMIEELCGDSPKKWAEVKQVAHDSLQMRIELWNAIDKAITTQLV